MPVTSGVGKKKVTIVVRHADGSEWTKEEYEQRASSKRASESTPSTTESLKAAGYKKTSTGGYRPPTQKEIIIEQNVKASPAAAQTLADYYESIGAQRVRTPKVTTNVGGAPVYSKTERIYEGAVSQEAQAQYAERQGMKAEEVQQIRSGQAGLFYDSSPLGFRPAPAVTTYQKPGFTITDSFGGFYISDSRPVPGSTVMPPAYSNTPTTTEGQAYMITAALPRTFDQKVLGFLSKKSEQAELRGSSYTSALWGFGRGAAGTILGMGQFIVSPVKGIYNMGSQASFYAKNPGVAKVSGGEYAKGLMRPSRAGGLVGTVAAFKAVGSVGGWFGRKAASVAPVRIKQGSLTSLDTVASDTGAVTMARQGATGRVGFFQRKFSVKSRSAQGTLLINEKQAVTVGSGAAEMRYKGKDYSFRSGNVGVVGKGTNEMVNVFAKTRIGLHTKTGFKTVSRGESLTLTRPVVEVGGLKGYGMARFTGGIKEFYRSSGRLTERFKIGQGKYTRTISDSVEKTKGSQNLGKAGGFKTKTRLDTEFSKSLSRSDLGVSSSIGGDIGNIKSMARSVLRKPYARVGSISLISTSVGGKARQKPIIRSKLGKDSVLRPRSIEKSAVTLDLGSKSILRPVSIQRQSSLPRQREILRTMAVPRQSSVLRQMTPQIPTIVPPRTPSIGIPTFKTPGPPIMPGMDLGGGTGIFGYKKPKRKKQPKEYQPSLYSSFAGFKGKPTKFGSFTGLGVRPIPTKRRLI